MNLHRTSFPLASLSLTLLLAIAGCGHSGVPSAGMSAPQATGPLQGAQSIEIRPQVVGYIDRVQFVEGAFVKQGQVLFRIDPRPFREAAERQLLARKRALVERDMARANHARVQRASGDHTIAHEEAERLSSADRMAASDLAAADAALSAAKLNLESTQVRAPIDGRVSRALITQGTLVTKESILTTIVGDEPNYAFVDNQRTSR